MREKLFLEEFLNLIVRNNSFLEGICPGLWGLHHTDNFSVFFSRRGLQCSNNFLSHNLKLFDLAMNSNFLEDRVILLQLQPFR